MILPVPLTIDPPDIAPGEITADITAWFATGRRRLALVFAKALEARFDADTSRDRGRMFTWYSLASLAAFILWDIATGITLTQQRNARLAHVGFVTIVVIVAAVIFATAPRKYVRESTALVVNVAVALSLAALYGGGWWKDTALFSTGMVTGLAAGTSVLCLRMPWAIASSAAIVAALAAGLVGGGREPAAETTAIVLTTLVAAGWLLTGAWRHERDERRGYLIGLQQSLGSQDLSRQNQALDDLSKRDALTGLANRRAHDVWLAEAWVRAGAADMPLGVIMIDIDKFKDYNDFYGHPAGDLCLAAIARSLRDQLRGTSDYVARLGGEEFVVLLDGVHEADCADVAERLRVAIEALDLPHLGIGPRGTVTVSAGVASTVPQAARSPNSLLAAADEALYGAKRAGRNCVAIGQLARPEVEAEERLFHEAAVKRARVG